MSKLQDLINESGLSDQVIARYTGLGESHVNKIRRGERKRLSKQTIIKLAEAFGIGYRKFKKSFIDE
jgi:transcriptional regulator with XRE-family HTH domain